MKLPALPIPGPVRSVWSTAGRHGLTLVVGGAALGAGAGIAVERALLSRDRARPDPAANEPFGRISGTPATVRSFGATRLHVEELGSGPCLVFAHGLSLSQHAWHYQRRDLPANFRCVFFDQRGHGRSGQSADDDYSLEALARDLAAVIAWTGEDQVVVVGHSMGGMGLLKLCELHPEALGRTVAGLVLVDTAYAGVMKGVANAGMARGADLLQRFVLTAGMRLAGKDPVRANQLRRRGSDLGYLGTRVYGFGHHPSPSQVAFIDKLLAGTDMGVWGRIFPSLIDFDLDHILAQIAVPTLVVVGGKDRLTPVTGSRHIAERIAGAELLELSESGHFAMVEEHEMVNSAIAALATGALPSAKLRVTR